MTFEEATILVTMHYILTLIFIGKRYFFSSKSTIFLIFGLLVNMTLILFLHNVYFITLILVVYLIEWIISSRYLKNKLLPLLYLFVQYILSITTFYITFDFQLQTKIGVSIPPIRLFILQACVVSILICCVLIIIEKYNLFEKIYFSKNSYTKISIFLFLLLITLIVTKTLVYNRSDKFIFLSIFLILASIIILVGIMLILFVHSKINKIKTDNLILWNTLKSQQEMYEFSREFQHDLKSLLIGIDGYLAENNIEEARMLLHKISTEGKDTVNQQYLTQLSVIDNLPIKATFYQFAATSIEKKIPFQFNIATNFKDTSIELLDFLRCLSIMLNNAIEAERPENENFFINVDVFKTKDSTNIIIKNPTTQNFKLQAIFQKGFSTKTHHKGLGLSNLRKIVNKNKKLELHYSLKRKLLIAELVILD